MDVLYLGLSNKIRGIFEALDMYGHTVHMVKPGEFSSRLDIAQSILKDKFIDIIVIGEILGAAGNELPQTKSMIQELRAAGISKPIFVLSNQYNTQYAKELE